MKYIEELTNGDGFKLNDQYFILTADFKKNGDKLAYSLRDGFPMWISSQQIVELIVLYTLDNDNNVIPIKDLSSTPTNIHQISSMAHQ